jgi:hypothetical protein
MRESEWRVVWNPLGENPRVLLTFGDLMEDEHARTLEHSVEIGRSDFAKLGKPISRGNVKSRIEFSRRNEHPSAGASWDACAKEIQSAPWGQKSLIQIQGRGGIPSLQSAALLASSHETSTGFDLPESVHRYSFRLNSGAIGLGPGIAVLGGVVLRDITLIIAPADLVGLIVGDIILILGVKGLNDGYYTISYLGPNFLNINGVEGIGPAYDESDKTKPQITFSHGWNNSPLSGEPLGDGSGIFLNRSALIRSSVPWEVLRSSGWVPFATTGQYTVNGHAFIPHSTGLHWSGLRDNRTAQAVAPDFIDEVRIRLVGQNGYNSIWISYDVEATGLLSDSNGQFGYNLPSIVASYGPDGRFNGPPNQIPPGGTIRKATLTETYGAMVYG